MIDSDASRHLTGYKEALSDLIEKDTNLEIILGDNATYPVKGTGTVTLHLSQGQVLHLQDVLYIPDLKKNLVSISAMEDKGFKVAFIDGKVRIWKNFKEALTIGFRVNTLYQVGGSSLGAMSCDTTLQTELWHQRFAHLHYKALPETRKVVTGMPEFKKKMNLKTLAEKLALRGRPQLRTLLSKMVLLKERTGPLWKLPTPCYVTKVFQSFYGEKLRTLLCMFKIDARILLWTPKLPKKSSLVRNLMFLILEFLVVLFTFMCRKKREASWMLLERRECLWAIFKLQRHI